MKFHEVFSEVQEEWLLSGPEVIDVIKGAKFATWRASEGNMKKPGRPCSHATVKKDMAALTYFKRTVLEQSGSMMTDDAIKRILAGLHGIAPTKDDDRPGVTEDELWKIFRWARRLSRIALSKAVHEDQRLQAMKPWSAAMLMLTAWGVLARADTLTRPPSGLPCRVGDIKTIGELTTVFLNRGGSSRVGIAVDGGTKSTGPVHAAAHNGHELRALWDEYLGHRYAASDRTLPIPSEALKEPAFPNEKGDPLSSYDILNCTRKGLRDACGKSSKEAKRHTLSTFRIGAESHLKGEGVEVELRQLYGRWKSKAGEVYERQAAHTHHPSASEREQSYLGKSWGGYRTSRRASSCKGVSDPGKLGL